MKKTEESSTFNNVNFWQTNNNGFGGIAPIDHLFNRLDGIYVSKWRAAFSNDSAIKNWRESWSEAIVEESLTPQEIKSGIIACRRSYDWPPSFPEFLKACRPSVDYERAHIEAMQQMILRSKNNDSWSSPEIYWAASVIGHDLNNFTYQQIRGRWKYAIDKARELIANGKLPNEVPERKMELPSPGKVTVSKEEAERRFAVINGILRKKLQVIVKS